jgi:phosphoribosylamine--glycine ligase
MRILVIGGGGREHAIGWRIKKDYKEAEIFFAPGNGGTEKIGINLTTINPENPYEVASICAELKIDLVVVGPENPLAYGIVDELQKHGRLCFGPQKEAAKLEASKSFAKKIMEEAGIPTAKFQIFSLQDFQKGKFSPKKLNPPVVIKASGLCAGKGTFVCKNEKEIEEAIERIFIKREFGNEGNEIVVEEFLEGKEISYFAICSENNFRTLGFARDYKRLLDSDKGPNTGGMGSYTPVEYEDDKLKEKIEKSIVAPLMKTLTEKNIVFSGILYVGVMLHNGEPYVLEFNVRFGDPEAQVLLPSIEQNFFDLIINALEGKLPDKIEQKKHALCVVMVAEGYPQKYKKGMEIKIKGDEEGENFIIFHAGTKRENEKIISTGGRVLNVVGLGENKNKAREISYKMIKEKIEFPSSHFRKDIGL